MVQCTQSSGWSSQDICDDSWSIRITILNTLHAMIKIMIKVFCSVNYHILAISSVMYIWCTLHGWSLNVHAGENRWTALNTMETCNTNSVFITIVINSSTFIIIDVHIVGILPKAHYLPCVSSAGRAPFGRIPSIYSVSCYGRLRDVWYISHGSCDRGVSLKLSCFWTYISYTPRWYTDERCNL